MDKLTQTDTIVQLGKSLQREVGMTDGQEPHGVGDSFGDILSRFRGTRGLTQEELAERAGVHVQEISKLERGARRNPRTTTIEFLAAALRLNREEKEIFIRAARRKRAPNSPSSQSTLVDRPPARSASLTEAKGLLASMPTDALPDRAPLPPGTRMPLAPNPLFVGRGDELLQAAKALRVADATVALGQVVASTGLGGLGKTQLAVELVHRYGRFFAGGVYWLSFASTDEVPLQVAACAGPEFECRTLDERVRRVKDAWQSAVPRLLVFDNCEEEALLEAWRPPSGGCRVLVTSRRAHWSATLGVTSLPLSLLPRVDSVELLRRYRPDVEPDDPWLDTIADELGDLPLALHLAGSYLRAYRVEVSLDRYLTDLRRSEVVLHASLLGGGLNRSPSPTHHVQSVAQTFALCLGRLDREDEVDWVALALLGRMACMAPGEPVPRDLLAKTLEDVESLLRADGLRRLGAVGLVEESQDWLRLHRLLVHFVRHEGLHLDAHLAVVRALIDRSRDADHGHLSAAAVATVIPHVVDVARAACGDSGDRLAAELCNAAGRALKAAGDLRGARPWYERALTIHEELLGPDHSDTAGSLNNLAQVLYEQGELATARQFYERALAIRERVLGSDHPDTAESLSNLAVLLRVQGDRGAARPLSERALSIWEQALGADHPYTLLALNNLAGLLRDQGELATARQFYERALAIRERVLGPDHPDTAFSLNGLARLLNARGEPDAAIPLFERALAIRERALGRDHPHTSRSLNDLAALHRDQGNPTAARPLFERALAIRERVLGPGHPDTVATRRALEELAGECEGKGAEG
jgi:tetratricopeptide (TPR) repeat protein/transcriptional regulator with XRE-family HTH domain